MLWVAPCSWRNLQILLILFQNDWQRIIAIKKNFIYWRLLEKKKKVYRKDCYRNVAMSYPGLPEHPAVAL